MWWIAACLGALVWLLSIRIKLKDQLRQGLARRGQLGGRTAALALDLDTDAKQRDDFVHKGFLPAAERYLREEPQINSILLLLARFLDEQGGPDTVHGEVLPSTEDNPAWPAAVEHSPVVQIEDGEFVMAPPQKHWDMLTELEEWRAALPAFAERLKPVVPSASLVEAYQPYAVVRRTGTGFELTLLAPDQPRHDGTEQVGRARPDGAAQTDGAPPPRI